MFFFKKKKEKKKKTKNYQIKKAKNETMKK
jgi:hypothetical protein